MSRDSSETDTPGLACPRCGCRVGNKVENTYQHEIIWRGQKIYKTVRRKVCRHCGKSFKSVEEVSDDPLAVEEKLPLPTPSKTTYEIVTDLVNQICPHCKLAFRNPAALKLHIEESHPSPKKEQAKPPKKGSKVEKPLDKNPYVKE